MNAILSFIRDEPKLRATLFWYWILSPLAFFFFTYMMAVRAGGTFAEALNAPSVALSFVTSCMSIIMAFLFRISGDENENTERVFCLYALVQQLIVGNLPGLLLSYFLGRSLWDVQREKIAPSNKRWLLLAGVVLISFLTLLTLVARINLWRNS